MEFPLTRLRRNRKHKYIRDLLSENNIQISDLIYPLFVCENGKGNVSGPGIEIHEIQNIAKIVTKASALGIKIFALFGNIDANSKDESGSAGFKESNIIVRAIDAIKQKVPDAILMCDVALDPYTSHGHDGVLNDNNTDLDNDKTIDALCKQSLLFANAGCDIISPSDMTDGRVGEIRMSLEGEGFSDVQIFSYGAKYASTLYAPFRQIVNSAKLKGPKDKKTYQLDIRNKKEAMRELAMDIEEGADALIIKPSMMYSDIISEASNYFDIPIIAYQVSGEYAMMKQFAKDYKVSEDDLFFESLISLKRAGANAIITYHAINFAKAQCH